MDSEYMIKKELAVYHRVPGSSDQKTDLFAFGEHPSYGYYQERLIEIQNITTGIRYIVYPISVHFNKLLVTYYPFKLLVTYYPFYTVYPKSVR